MDGIGNATLNEALPTPGSSDRELLVSSRRDALETMRRAITVDGAGPILLTGEPGTGKTWLWRRLVSELPAGWRWLSVEMSEAIDALEFLALINHGLGISHAGRLGSARLALSRALLDEASDGRFWVLVIENAQNTAEQVWNELLALIHEMEAYQGFNSILLVGPTELARLLATRQRSAPASRIATHAHLLSLDLQECRELVHSQGALLTLDRVGLEELHRDAAGNPRRILQLMRKQSKTIAKPAASVTSAPAFCLSQVPIDTSVSSSGSAPALALPAASVPDSESPVSLPLVPDRPPLRVEEGLIEVGWGGNLEAESTAPAQADPIEPVGIPGPDEGDLTGEELIEDHYAALQAWSEWATNRGRAISRSGTEAKSTPIPESSPGPEGERSEAELQPPDPRLLQGMRAESQHEHAPYSQLFSRLRQSR
jgi:general secretion pathway protein A